MPHKRIPNPERKNQMISNQDKSRLQDLPIGKVAQALGLKVNGQKAICPFHDDSNPSLCLRKSTNRYRCFVCGAHGGVIDLVMSTQPVRPPTAQIHAGADKEA